MEKARIVKNVGDVMYDSILYYSKLAEKRSTILRNLGLFPAQTPQLRNSELRTITWPPSTALRIRTTRKS